MESYDFNEYGDRLDKGSYYHHIRNTPWYRDAVYPRFSQDEFRRRHEKVRQAMIERGYDGLIVPGGQAHWGQGGALVWLTGVVDRRSLAQYLVVPRDGEALLVYAMGGAHAELARIWSAVPQVRAAARGQFAKEIVAYLRHMGLESGRIGVLEASENPGVEWPPEAQMQVLYEELPDARIELVSGLFHELAFTKSQEEVEAIGRAGALAVAALKGMVSQARPGMSEHQLSSAAMRVILAAEGRPASIRVGSTPGRQPAITAANPLPSQRRFRPGDLLLLEVSAMLQGVTAQVGTAMCLGQPADAVQRLWHEVLVPGFEQLESLLRPGVPLKEIQKASRWFRGKGYQTAPLLLHGLDIDASKPWVFTDDIVAEPFERKLQAGMVVVLRPNPIQADGRWGMGISRTYLVGEDGPACLTDYPLELVGEDRDFRR